MPLRVAILISGRGSNMTALAKYAAQDDVPAEIAVVLADQPAEGLAAAEKLGLPTAAILRSDYATAADHEAAIIEALDQAKADVVFLAGYMRLLSARFCHDYEGRLFNIHPSLLPRHKGLDTHAKALAAGDEAHGCSVHMVSPEMDDGLVLAQRQVRITPDDTEESLAAKVLKQEHLLYPALLGALASGLLVIKDGVPEMQIGPLPGQINGQEAPMNWPI